MNASDQRGYNIAVSPIPSSVRFGLLLTFEIPSIIVYLFVIGYILTSKTRRLAPHNYVMLLILVISFILISIDIPFSIDYCRPQPTIVQSPAFCLIWWFVDLCCFYTCQILVAWASFERHILIFHERWLLMKWNKICFHYIPPLILIIYMLTFYIYVIFIYPCETYFNFETRKCIYLCYINDPNLALWESIFHGISTTICILVFNCLLLVRVYRSKMRLRQPMNWRKYRKIHFQLISISTLYLSINFPLSIIYIFYIAGFSDWTEQAILCLSYLNYFIPLLLPFIYSTSLPEFGTKLKRIIHCGRNRQIAPIQLHTLAKNDRPVIAQT